MKSYPVLFVFTWGLAAIFVSQKNETAAMKTLYSRNKCSLRHRVAQKTIVHETTHFIDRRSSAPLRTPSLVWIEALSDMVLCRHKSYPGSCRHNPNPNSRFATPTPTPQGGGYRISTILVTNRSNRSHLYWIFSKFLTFTPDTFVLTSICPCPSLMLSHAYFGAVRRL